MGLCTIEVKNLNCRPDQKAIRGHCFDIPSNCADLNDHGFCSRCINSDFRLVYNTCIYDKKCGARQFKDINGVCQDVIRYCAFWNPSNG